MTILGISGSLSKSSKTELVVRKTLEFASGQGESVITELMSLSDYSLQFCDGRNPDLYEGDSRTVLDKIAKADAYIVGSPIYRGTYSGAFKNLFDLIPNNVLEGKVIGIVATGGSDHHFLAIEHQFKPLFGYFNAYTIPGGVYASNRHFSDGGLINEEIISRLNRLAEETVRLSTRLNQTYSGPDYPAIERETLTES